MCRREGCKEGRRVQVGMKGTSRHKGKEWAQAGIMGESLTFKLVTVQFINRIDYTNVGIQWLIQNFPGGTKSGVVNQSIILQNVCRKLHENEIISKTDNVMHFAHSVKQAGVDLVGF